MGPAERPDFNAHLEMVKINRKARIEAERRKVVRERIFASSPGLEEALEHDHYIVRDIRSRLYNTAWGISDKQIALVHKIVREAKEKAAKPEEVKVAAPVSSERQVIKGILVSKKSHEGPYGTSIKGTIKVTTPEGVWLCWGTLPNVLLGHMGETAAAVGDEIEFSAKLQAGGRDAHFAFFKRPTNARIVTKAAPKSEPELAATGS